MTTLGFFIMVLLSIVLPLRVCKFSRQTLVTGVLNQK